MTAKFSMIGDIDRDLVEALECLRDGDIEEAKDIVRSYAEDFDIARQVERMLRDMRLDDAILALERFADPKFKSKSACAKHAGNTRHY